MKTYKTFYQQEAGVYRNGCFTIVRIVDEAGRKCWSVRANGLEFDRAATLAAAKNLCK